MLTITVPGTEMWNPEKELFYSSEDEILKLEHSLISISKWESKWHKPFLTQDNKTSEEVLSYIQCMTVNGKVDPEVYYRLSPENVSEIDDYIGDAMTATFFYDDSSGGGAKEQVTSELIYYWMVTLNVPFECQRWHLNRLLTLLRVCNIKNSPPKQMGTRELIERNKTLNQQRRQMLKSKG